VGGLIISAVMGGACPDDARAGFEKVARKCFEECDVDADSRISLQELYICVLLIYDKMNAKLPCHMKPPGKAVVTKLFLLHDTDGSGHLSYDEFLIVARVLFADEKSFKDSILLRVVTTLVLKMVVWPMSAVAVKSGLCAVGLEQADKIPSSVISHACETAGKYASSYIATC
jgi:Ca2+-binding EF-hand superfamily protein